MARSGGGVGSAAGAGEAARVQKYFEEAVGIHHMCARKWSNENDVDTKIRESIVNKTSFTVHTNRILGGDAASLYLAGLKMNHRVVPGVLDKGLRSHLIDPECLGADSVHGFFDARQGRTLGGDRYHDGQAPGKQPWRRSWGRRH
jgi:hypothetical protein